MQLSKLENNAYETIRKNAFSVFKINDLCLLMNIKKTKAYNIIKSLKKKNAIKKIGKGFFALEDSEDFIIGTSINYPSYISFWSALNYYGFSDQNPKKIFIATSKYSKDIGNFKYITLSKKRFFGYVRNGVKTAPFRVLHFGTSKNPNKPRTKMGDTTQGFFDVKIGQITIAEKEKAIIDSLLFPKYAGGIKEITKCLKNSLNEINIDKLIDYAIKVKSKAILRRMGFILENLTGKKLERLRKKIGKGYELLDPSLKRKNNLNHRWLLDINAQ